MTKVIQNLCPGSCSPGSSPGLARVKWIKSTSLVFFFVVGAFLAPSFAEASAIFFQIGASTSSPIFTGEQMNFTLGDLLDPVTVKAITLKASVDGIVGQTFSLIITEYSGPNHTSEPVEGTLFHTFTSNEINTVSNLTFTDPIGIILKKGRAYSFSLAGSIGGNSFIFGSSENAYGNDVDNFDIDSSCLHSRFTGCLADFGNPVHDLFFIIEDSLPTPGVQITQPVSGQIVNDNTFDVCVSFSTDQSSRIFTSFTFAGDETNQVGKFLTGFIEPIANGVFCSVTGFLTLDNGTWIANASLIRPDNSIIITQENPTIFHINFVTAATSTIVLTSPGGVPTKEFCDNLSTEFLSGFCNILAGTFTGVLSFLFRPQQTSYTQFNDLKELVLLKPPFGFFALIKDSFSNLTASTTPAFQLAEVAAVTENIFLPLKTGLSFILWLVFGVWIFRKITTFQL